RIGQAEYPAVCRVIAQIEPGAIVFFEQWEIALVPAGERVYLMPVGVIDEIQAAIARRRNVLARHIQLQGSVLATKKTQAQGRGRITALYLLFNGEGHC